MNHALLLIRNILHAPERPTTQAAGEPGEPDAEGPANGDAGSNSASGSECQHAGSGAAGTQTQYMGPNSHSHGYAPDCSQQNRLLWNLFAQGLDRLLMQLLACSQKVSPPGRRPLKHVSKSP